MRCPKCGGQDDKVIDSRASREGAVIRRRRECLLCEHRYTTYEEIERARANGRVRVIRYGISDEQAWDVGLACGGTIDVLVAPLVPRVAVAAALVVAREGATHRRDLQPHCLGRASARPAKKRH